MNMTSLPSPKGSGGEHLSPANPKSALTVSSYRISSFSDIVVFPKISSPRSCFIIIDDIIAKSKKDSIAIVGRMCFKRHGSRQSKTLKVRLRWFLKS